MQERYDRLGISANKGNKVKTELLQQNVVEEQRIRFQNTTRVVLRVTKQGKQTLGLTVGDHHTRESIAHEYRKNYYARRFTRLGYEVQVEAPRKGGRVDVLATNSAERVAIEIETGKSNVVDNVKNNLTDTATKILIVCTDKQALELLERQLARAGLFIQNKVMLMMREFPVMKRTL